MNEIGCQRAIRWLLEQYSDVLTYGHYQNGTYRTIAEIVLSPLTPPQEYYHILVQAEGVKEASDVNPGNQVKPPRVAIYDCTIHVVDPAFPSNIVNAEQYEVAHEDFRTMCDGIAALIAGSTWHSSSVYSSYFTGLPVCMTDPQSDSKFSMVRGSGDRGIDIRNMDHTWKDPDNETWTPIMYSRISFKLESR